MDENEPQAGQDEVVEEVIYRSATSQEMTAREAAIDSMLGTRLRKDMNDLEVTVSDYSADLGIVVDHFSRYLLGKDNLSVINKDGTKEWKRKSSGLLRNYLVSRMALRDHTYVLVKKYWEADPDTSRDEDTAFMDLYRAKVKSILVKPQ